MKQLLKTPNKLFPEEQTDLSMNCLQRFVNSKAVLSTSGKHVHEINTLLYPSFIYFNWGLHGYTFFLFFVQNIDCGYSLETPHPGGGEAILMCTTTNVLSKQMENI